MKERITEKIVRKHFDDDSMCRNIKSEESGTRNPQIKELLKNASKKGTGKPGYPDFTITFFAVPGVVIVIECKEDTKFHESQENTQEAVEKYAVNGALHYASYLKNELNVIAIGVSGTDIEQMMVSNFYIKKNSTKITRLPDLKLLSLFDYLNIFEQKDKAEKLKDENILVFASELNQKLYNYSVPENERATIVSGILIGLQDKTFRTSYQVEKKPSELAEDLLTSINRVLNSKKMGDRKTKILMGEYSKISQSNKLAISEVIRNIDTGEDEPNYLLRDIIIELDRKVFPFTEYQNIGYDILGQFYSEFIRYVYGDKKLGLVLTPQHVTELFVDIANINVDDVIYDNCCGTAGFLIKSMKKLMELAGNDNKKKKKIKESQLIGVEERSDMFTYACSNMMMRGDGKSNIHLGDSLSQSVKETIKGYKPTVGFLNPPYSTNVSELEFISSNLDCLEKNSTCVAIVPINCVLDQSGIDYEWKKKLLEKHTLEAVFSMPDELFNPAASVVPAIVVFKAHIPHPSDYETYFGYWKDDGFIKVKHLGRVDFHSKWEKIKSEWVYNYKNKKEMKEHSIKKHVTADDEWCAEAYLETDYSQLKEEDFEIEIKKYVMFMGLN